MNFLRLSPGAAVSAPGGWVLASEQPDLAMAYQNPALLESGRSTRLHSSFLFLPGGSSVYFLSGITSKPKASLVTALSLQYIDHGSVPATDAGGNLLGSFRPRDWSIQLAASLPYQSRWRGGAALQWAHSAYGIYRSTAVLSNVGIRYRDTANGFTFGAILRHAGFFVRRYDGGSTQQLPLELAFGVWKKWKDSPFAAGIVWQRMQRWALETDDLFDPNVSPIGVDNRRSTFIGQFFNHLILSARVDLHPQVQFIGGYNFLRRWELSWAGGSNGLSGFSYGLKANLHWLQVSFARSHYLSNQSLHQLSLEFSLKPTGKGWKR